MSLCLLAARRLGRPVRWTATRTESFLSRQAMRATTSRPLELALDADGDFLALRVRTLANIGAYRLAGADVSTNNVGGLAGVYPRRICHGGDGVFTNTQPTAPYRGAGRPEAIHVIERLVDLAARELGIDRGGDPPPQHDPAGADAVPDRARLHL